MVLMGMVSWVPVMSVVVMSVVTLVPVMGVVVECIMSTLEMTIVSVVICSNVWCNICVFVGITLLFILISDQNSLC